MTRKAMSIIGRIIGLILVVALAFGITWCATHWGTVQAELDRIFNKTPQQEQPENPTPDKPDNPPQEEINLDGFYYIDVTDVDGGIVFVQIKENAYRSIGGRMTDSNIYFFDGWETKTEFETLNTTEDEKYIHVYCEADKIAIYDKATSTLYYDFSNGEQFPGGTYEDQLLYEMVPFTEYEVVECSHETEMEITSSPASCTESGTMEIFCYDCNALLRTETIPALGHDYVNGVCSRCGETALTWQLNDTIQTFGEETIQYNINFTSNDEQFISFQFTLDAAPCLRFMYDDTNGVVAYDESNYYMSGEAYRTVTFDTAPTGELLTWLIANATPQA